MIQRIQSIFLLLAAGFFGGQFFTSFASTDAASQGFFADKLYSVMDHPLLMVVCGLGIALALAAIFMYNNRQRQLTLANIATTLGVLLPLIALLLFNNQKEAIAEETQIADQAGLYLPIGVIIMGILANVFIRKDDKLVKSMDRLR